MASLVLASSSPYRRALLERLRLPFAVASPAVDERPRYAEMPRATALRLAQSKARAVATRFPTDVIIGSDQVAVLDGSALGKPGAKERAFAQLAAMRGKVVVFHTALCVIDGVANRCEIDEIPTTVQFRDYTDAQARRYLELDEPYDCAGSAKIEALGVALVEAVESRDPTALIGLPLISLVAMLARAGIDVL